MVGEDFEIYLCQMVKNAFKLSTMVGENFEIYLCQMVKNAFKLSTMVGEILKFTYVKWLKMHLNCPPWLEKMKFTYVKWLKMHLNCPPWLEKILEYYHCIHRIAKKLCKTLNEGFKKF